MWHTNPNTNQSQNLPSVLKNFNAFDLLEPQKVNHESTDVSTAVLIDVTDSMNRQEKLTDISPDLHGSFLEKVKKTEFDLLDLYQNIYVTPQEIKKEPLEDCRTENKNPKSNPEIEAFKIDFTELFEKAEQGKQLSEWPKQNENVNKATKNIPQLNLTNKNSRSFDEILDNDLDSISSRCSQLKLDPPPKLELDIPKLDPICEDDIDDFLQPKLVIDPSIFEETAQNMCSIGSLSHFNNDTPPVTSLSLNDRRQNLLKSLSKPIKATVGDKPSDNIISKVCPEKQEIQRSVYNHDVRSQIPFTLQDSNIFENKTCSSKIKPQSDVTPIYCKQITTNLTDLNSPPVPRSTCQETIPILHTVKMDPKAYLKRRIVKKDAEKIGFMKGPDIYEKSIVLPQIMKRLAERKQGMEEQLIQRKLILETTDHDRNHHCDGSNGVANNKKCMKTQIPEAPIKKTTYLMHESSKEERPAKLGEFQKSEGFLKPEMSLKPPAYYLEPNTSVALNPKVLMEDCSLKRVKTLQTRIAFEKFVNTGKLPP